MNWLREHGRGPAPNAAPNNARENILDFPRVAGVPPLHGAPTAVDLVSQAAVAIQDIQDRAVESENRARALAESAIEKLKLAEARIHEAEAARRAAEENFSKFGARLQDAERKLAGAQARNSALEAQLASTQQRLNAAEARAIHAEKAVHQIEDAIRTQLVGLQRNLTRRSATAA
jgi:chromosome segregation ATPase